MRNIRFMPALAAVAAALALGVAACGGDDGASSSAGGGGSSEELNGTIRIDGSSTVFPFAEAAGELFNEEQPGVQVTVGQSGTGGGFEKFCAGETDISDASRPIKDDEEAPVCEKAGIKYDEVQVANDGIAVVTNKNLAVDCLTVDQLKAIWEPRVQGREPQGRRRRPPGRAAEALRPGHRLGHLRLLHRPDQRRRGRVARGLRGLRGRQPARDRRVRHRGRPRLLRLLLLRAERRTSSTWSASARTRPPARSPTRLRSRTAPIRRSRARCSCTRPTRPCSGPRSRRSWSSWSTTTPRSPRRPRSFR